MAAPCLIQGVVEEVEAHHLMAKEEGEVGHYQKEVEGEEAGHYQKEVEEEEVGHYQQEVVAEKVDLSLRVMVAGAERCSLMAAEEVEVEPEVD